MYIKVSLVNICYIVSHNVFAVHPHPLKRKCVIIRNNIF